MNAGVVLFAALAVFMATAGWLVAARWKGCRPPGREGEGRGAVDRLEARRRIERHISEQLDLDQLLVIVATSALRLIGGTFSVVFLREDNVLRPGAWAGVPDWIRDIRVPLGSGVAGSAVASGEGLIVNDYTGSPLALPPFSNASLRLLAQPLLAGGRALGAMLICRDDTGEPFTDDDLAALEDFATQAAVAMQNASLFAEAKRRAAEYQALFAVAGLVSSTLDTDRVLDVIVDRCRALMGVVSAAIFRLEDEAIVCERAVGLSPDFVRSLRLRLGEGATGRAVRDRAPSWSADITADAALFLSPETQRLVAAEGPRAILSVPILGSGNALHGALSAYWWEPHAPIASEIELMSAFAGQAAIALENARLYAALDARASRLRTLARLCNMMSSSLDARAVLEAIARAAALIMKTSFVSVYVADESTRTLELRAVSDERIGAGLDTDPRGFGEGLVGWVADHRQSLRVPDVLADPRAVSQGWARAHGLSSFFGVPIVFQGSLLGVLTLNDPAPLRLGADDESLLETFVSQAAVAIRNTRLYEETTQHLAKTRALLQVAEILNSTLDPHRVLKRVAIKIALVCHVDRCSIERWDGDRVVPLMSQFADGRREDAMWTAFTAGPNRPPRRVPAHARAIETRRPVIIPDASASDLIPREWTEAFGLKSCMAVPLIRQDTVIGVMTLDHIERVTPFEPWQVDLAMAIGGQVALSIENTRLYAESQERLRETSTLLAVAGALSQPGPPVDVMRRTAREVARAFGAGMVGIYVLDAAKEALVPIVGYHVPRHLLPVFGARPFVLSRFKGLGETWRAGRAFHSSDVTNDPRIDRDTFAGVDPHSVLFAPTMVRGEAVGALFIVWWGAGREFQPAEIRLVEGVASQLGLAMENAELARQTQQKLEETERLLAVSRTLSSTLDLGTLPRHFLRHVVGAAGADCAGMWLLDEAGEWMEPLVGYRIPPAQLEALRGVRVSVVEDAFYAEAVRSRRPMVSTDVMHDARIPAALRDAVPHRTQLFVPIVAKSRVIGGFAIAWWDTERQLARSELELMEGIASQAGVALDNARLFRDNQRRVEELSVLHELSRAVTGQLDQSGLLQTVEQHVARLLGVQDLSILLHDDVSDRIEVALRVVGGARDLGEPRQIARAASGLAGVVLETGRPLRTSDAIGECVRRQLAPPGVGAHPTHWLGVPMAAGRRTLGVLVLESRDREFTERDQHLLANVADLAALALRTARLYDERARAHDELAAAQDQLVRTEKLRAMGEMASGVAHDFNNVLAAILGRAQLLHKRVQDPKLGQWIEVIERSALDGARTVRRLQDFTRIRRDHPVVAVDLNQVVRQTLEATESSWRPSQRRGGPIDVTTRLAPSLPQVPGDPSELREALTNFILNALDAMPNGGTLGLATSSADGQVEIAVADTGIGIPADIRHKIFDPFFTTKGPKGNGLGLSMAYGIVSRHGGRITVDSEEGRGTTFRLIFPAAEVAAAPATPAVAVPVSAAALRCLVVDDEELVAGVLGDMLLSAGHRVEVVSSGQDAVARFDAERFDLVLTDLAMPGMTGWEVARAIKDVAPGARVVLVSGFGVEVSPEDLHSHGVDLVLAKPLRLEDIQSAVALARSEESA